MLGFFFLTSYLLSCKTKSQVELRQLRLIEGCIMCKSQNVQRVHSLWSFSWYEHLITSQWKAL